MGRLLLSSFLIGFSTTLIYFTLNQERKLKALLFVKINLFIVLLGMLIFGIDGIFCLLMMVPILVCSALRMVDCNAHS